MGCMKLLLVQDVLLKLANEMRGFCSQAKIRTNVSGLLEGLKDERYAWMRLRITETWPQWVEAIKQLTITRDMSRRKRKKVELLKYVVYKNPVYK